MKRQLKCLLIMIIVFIFLFPNKFVLADVDINNIKFKFTCYSREETNNQPLHTGLTYNDFTINSKHNWYEYNYNGQTYVVLAAATKELLAEWGGEKDYIHYFNLKDTIQFKFEDSGFDSNVYNGMILDSCGASMNVAEGEPQILDVYTAGGSQDAINNSINQKIVLLSDTGVFMQSELSENNSVGSKIVNCIIDFFANGFNSIGDAIHLLISNETAVNEENKVTFSKEEIEKNKKLQNQIQVTDASKTESENSHNDAKNTSNKTNILKEIDVESQVDNRSGKKETIYTTSTEIPVIPIDWYSASINKINLFNVNFYNNSNSNPNKLWQKIRYFVFTFSRVILYLTAALLIVMLIWRSILFVLSTITDNATKSAESKKIMDGWVKAIIMIVGIYFLMSLVTYLYNYILTFILNGNDSNYLIKLNVKDVYSFNTNSAGYIRYLSLRSNTWGALGYSFIYFIISLFDLIWYLFMGLRMICIGLLTIIAPITAFMFMTGKVSSQTRGITKILHFRNWIKLYMRFMWIPLAVVIIQKVVLML